VRPGGGAGEPEDVVDVDEELQLAAVIAMAAAAASTAMGLWDMRTWSPPVAGRPAGRPGG